MSETKKAKSKKPASNSSGTTTTRAAIGSGQFHCDACNRMLSTDYSLKRHRQICQKYKDRQPNQQQEYVLYIIFMFYGSSHGNFMGQ